MNEDHDHEDHPESVVITPDDTTEDNETVQNYRSLLIACLNFTTNTTHEKNYIATQEELLALTPDHIYAYLANKAYGTPNPGIDARPTEGRSSTLEYGKKALSYFMPN